MTQITITLPDESLAGIAATSEEASAELRMLAAVKLFELKKVSSGAAARSAGISRVEFLKRLGDYGVATFRQSEEGLLDEIRNA